MEEFKGDKRTKAYKEWVKAQKEAETTGLGDVVEKVTNTLGIKKKEGCGCEERKEKWNKIRWSWKPVNCFTEEQYDWWTNFREENPSTIKPYQVEQIRLITITLFARDIGRPSCCMKQHIDRIDQVYERYQ